jgi:4-amino-4-deoxy-L-arabinose transferase-like glycosyltransferase
MMPTRAPASRDRSERAAVWGAALLVVWIGALVGSTLSSVRYVPLADEGYYRSYAARMAERGPGAFPETFEAYRAEPRHWRFPNPLRVGYIGIAAGWTALRGDSFRALSEISLVSHCLLVAVCFGFLRRLTNGPIALASSALVAFSPLLLGLSRRALLDAPATLLSLATLWAFWECLRNPAPRAPRAAFMLCFGLGMLVKETTLLLLVPFGLLLAVAPRRQREAALPALLPALLAPPVICACIWLLAAGSLGTLLDVVRIILASPGSNPYAQQLGGGPWWRYLIDLLLLSPGPTLLALAAAGHALFEARAGRSHPARSWLALFALGLLLAYAPFTKNVRYVAPIELPLRALAALGLFALCGREPGWRRGAAVAAAVGLLCWLDWRHFERVFVAGALDDPVSAYLLQARELIPGPAPPP